MVVTQTNVSLTSESWRRGGRNQVQFINKESFGFSTGKVQEILISSGEESEMRDVHVDGGDGGDDGDDGDGVDGRQLT